MTTTTIQKGSRRVGGASEQSRGMLAWDSGAIEIELGIDEAIQPRPTGSVSLSDSLRSAADCGLRIEEVRTEGAEGHGGEELRGDFMVDDHDPMNAQAALVAADALMVELGEAGREEVRTEGAEGTEGVCVSEVWGYGAEGWKLEDVNVVPAGLNADGVRYGPMGLVALVVVGVPVRRRLAMDDEMSWLWAREARLEAVRSELAAGRRWAEWELLCKRLDRVYAQSNERWRRWREGPPMSAGVCKSLVVVGVRTEDAEGTEGVGRLGAIGDVVDGVVAGGCPLCGGVLEERDGFDADGFEISGRSCAVCVEMFIDGEVGA